MKEIFRTIKNYEDYYEISNLGRVRNKKLKIFRKYFINHRGYFRVGLHKNGKMLNYSVHRLVAEAFIDNPEKKYAVNHIDGNKKNNIVNNLEWVTCSENHYHAFNILNRVSPNKGKFGKLNHKSIKVVQFDLSGNKIKEWGSINEAGRNGFNVGSICACCKDRAFTHKKYKWKYKYDI